MGRLTSGAAVPVPMTYTQIADDLTARIRSGEYPPGAELPSYTKLGELYSVGRTTAARVYSILRDRGLVYGAPGRAVYVVDSSGKP